MKWIFRMVMQWVFPRAHKVLGFLTRKRNSEPKVTKTVIRRDEERPLLTRSEMTEKENNTLAEFERTAARHAKAGDRDGISGLRSMAKRDIEISHGLAEEKTNLEYDIRTSKIEGELAKAKANFEDDSHLELGKTQEARRKIELRQEVEREALNSSDSSRKALPISQQISSLERELEKSLEEKEWQDSNLIALVKGRYGDRKPRRSWIDNEKIFLAIVGLLILIEWYVNFEAFQKVEGLIENNLGAIIFGLALATFQAFGAKGYGAYLFRQDKPKKLAFLLFTLFACGFISYFRFAKEADFVASIASVSINVIIALMTGFLAYFHERHVDYFDCIKQRDHASDRIYYCEGELDKLRKEYASKLELAETGAVEERLSHETQRREGYESKINQLEAQLKEVNLERGKELSQLEDVKNDAMAQYESDFLSSAKVAGHHRDRKNRLPLGGNGVKISSLLIVGASLLASCGNTLPDKHVEVVLDVTGKVENFNSRQVEEEVFNALELANVNDWSDVIVNVSTISHVTETAVTEVKLEKSGNFITRNESEHEGKKEKFRLELKQAIESAALSREEKLHSYVNRNLSARMHFLVKQKGEKQILVWSDLLQHRPPEVSFYHYKYDVGKLDRDAEELIAKMEADSPLPELQGVRLVNFHLPDKSTDELHLGAKNLFSKYWSNKNLEMEFRTSTKTIKTPLVELK